MKQPLPAPSTAPKHYYRRPLIDRPLGHYVAEWDGPNGRVELQTLNRLRDWEGNSPSLYSVLRLPYVVLTYLQAKRSPILPNPVPFLVVDAIKRLEEIIRPGMKVLEVGGGNSTLWFLDKGAEVTTVESDAGWAHLVEKAAKRGDRLQMHIARGQDALSFIEDLPDHSFDIALIDSDFTEIPRNDCVPRARQRIVPGGWLVLDNSDHPANWLGVDAMADRRQERYVGYSTMALNVCQTSIWQL